MTERYILDCSVAAKWYLLDEEEVDVAQLIQAKLGKGTLELHAPELLRYEVGNVLSKAHRSSRPRLSRMESERAFDNFCHLNITFHSLGPSALQEAFSFANRFHRNYYDSCYLWLAEKLDCPWLTAEKKFRGPFPLGFPKDRVQILSMRLLEFDTDL